ncbi:4Fe-4S dicluster domain-containing protein [Agathobacter rectalis]|uniref:4Fe-4S dicluster domain-containing protein n=1 Tax=Agathobacter rectalis TaxID=39491 RepID=A0A415I424_9FIRM|nr:4Fe-4S dicluster domain-containing protein [Agathobacter rectalis]
MKDNFVRPPILYKDKLECCGCTACYSICPKAAIIMKMDEEGFYYPIIIDNKCVACLKCINICPLKNKST